MFPLQTHCGGGELQLGLAGPPRLHKLLCEWLKRLRNPLDAQSTSHSPRQSRHGPVVLFSKASVQHQGRSQLAAEPQIRLATIDMRMRAGRGRRHEGRRASSSRKDALRPRRQSAHGRRRKLGFLPPTRPTYLPKLPPRSPQPALARLSTSPPAFRTSRAPSSILASPAFTASMKAMSLR